MSEYAHHDSLRLENFTAFTHTDFDFVPGLNIFVGENGTGKTHVMKALYAMQLTQSREERSLGTILEDIFQTKYAADVIRQGTSKGAIATVRGSYGGFRWEYGVQQATSEGIVADTGFTLKPTRPVFIPAIDMMGHTKGFTEAYEEVRLDFDLTCRDIVNLLRLERKNGTASTADMPLAKLLNGSIERDEQGRFYLVNAQGRLPMPMVAEGLRKIATLVQLDQNGWLVPGTTLFWDEPEVNLNPIVMDEMVEAILSLTRRGVQVFLATHSYVILKEIDLQAQKSDAVRYFAFQPGEQGTTVHATEDFTQLSPNSILDQYASLYDRELTRSTGRSRNGERVS